jgi:hypothetical protein
VTQPQGPFTAAEREFIVSAIAKNHGLTRAEAELIFERDRPAKRNPLLEQQWVHNLHHLCDALREGRARPVGLFASAFWIRLYGVITELLGDAFGRPPTLNRSRTNLLWCIATSPLRRRSSMPARR